MVHAGTWFTPHTHTSTPFTPPAQASDHATLSWLEGQAMALLRERARLQKELEKYRPVRRHCFE